MASPLNTDEEKSKIEELIATVSEAILWRVAEKFLSCIRQCVEARGGCHEHALEIQRYIHNLMLVTAF